MEPQFLKNIYSVILLYIRANNSVQSIAKIVIQFEVLTERNIEKNKGFTANSNFKRRKAGWQVRVKVKMPWDKKII